MPPRGPRYSITPEQLSTDTRLVGCDWRVLHRLGRLADKTGWCRVRQKVLAVELGLNRVTVLRSLKRLEGLGYVETHASRRDDGGNGSCWYRLKFVSDQAELFETPEQARAAAPPCSADATGPCGTDDTGHVASRATQPLSRPGRHSIRTSLEERTADDARTRSSSPRRRKEPPRPQPSLLLPIAGGGPAASGAATGPPPHPPSRRAELDRLEAALRDAAGASLNAIATALMVLSDPQRWLAAGCDLERDILPVLRAVAVRARPGSVQTWGYFAAAVFEARDRRLAPAPAGSAPPTRGGDHAARHESPTRAALRRVRGG